ADRQRLLDYRSEAEELWPTSPASVEAMERWLEKARELAARLGDHQSALAELRRRAIDGEQSREPPGGDPAKPADETPRDRLWKFSDPEDEARHEMLSMLVAGLAEFMDKDPSKGAIAMLERRLDWAPSPREFEARWRQAAASIGDPRECPGYGGLRVEPIDGLVPIGRDPDSGLWEFACVRTGRAPERGAGGRYAVSEETAVVLVLVPGGAFIMGSPESEEYRQSDETQHEVTLSAFFLSKYEVTQAQWRRLMKTNPSRFKGDDLPVEQVSWDDCLEFCRKLGLNLPTEAQWEYACRAGTNRPYAGTGHLDDMGWYLVNSGEKTQPVGKKQPNGFGLHDMHGNVWEWCGDTYDARFYATPEACRKDPVCTSGSEYRVDRGGGLFDVAAGCRSADRYRYMPGNRYRYLGFRPAMAAREETTTLAHAVPSPARQGVGEARGPGTTEVASDREGMRPIVNPSLSLIGTNPEGYDEYLHEPSGIIFVSLPGGTFHMGSPASEAGRDNDEGPVHEVELSPFLIAKHEVTQAEWRKVMGTSPSHFKGDELPVESVSWDDCREFCRKAGLRLPTEAQWEYACRAGKAGPHAGTGKLDEMGWYRSNSGGKTQPVGSKRPNGFGLHDMHGNVWELCEDVYDVVFYAVPEARLKDPVSASGPVLRVSRGGGWKNDARNCRSADRIWDMPCARDWNLGFRPAMLSP
ncbi:MAG: formylglycine-generating enzyme family protein, partial [Planctomycetes bacterium]|nr:formylglycine-generating enzyme family protein [Planctomycetota bacterium]